MTERPILFSASMIRALLDGTKTQTRRVVTWRNSYANFPISHLWDFGRATVSHGLDVPGNQYLNVPFAHPEDGWEEDPADDTSDRVRCRIKTGDHLWVRETWAPMEWLAIYRADSGDCGVSWRPSIHMPRWASRITLQVTGVRVERVQDITFEDALAEGIIGTDHWTNPPASLTAALRECSDTFPDTNEGFDAYVEAGWEVYAREVYRALWDSINGRRPGCAWADNPFVWCVSFRRVPLESAR